MEGRDVTLRIYTEAADVPQAAHAMASLKRAMKWDEDTYGVPFCFASDSSLTKP